MTTTGSSAFFDAIAARRSIYSIRNETPISDSQINDLVNKAITQTPSTFNSQSTRILVLLRDDHTALWEDIVKPAVKAAAPAEVWGKSEKRLNGFRDGFGTVLFYEDPLVVAKCQELYPLYVDRFPQWSEHTSAMHQLVVWTALEAEGFGASLQHYNPLIDALVSRRSNVPQDWSLKAQVVFGKPTGQALFEKTFLPLTERVFIYGTEENYPQTSSRQSGPP